MVKEGGNCLQLYLTFRNSKISVKWLFQQSLKFIQHRLNFDSTYFNTIERGGKRFQHYCSTKRNGWLKFKNVWRGPYEVATSLSSNFNLIGQKKGKRYSDKNCQSAAETRTLSCSDIYVTWSPRVLCSVISMHIAWNANLSSGSVAMKSMNFSWPRSLSPACSSPIYLK